MNKKREAFASLFCLDTLADIGEQGRAGFPLGEAFLPVDDGALDVKELVRHAAQENDLGEGTENTLLLLSGRGGVFIGEGDGDAFFSGDDIVNHGQLTFCRGAHGLVECILPVLYDLENDLQGSIIRIVDIGVALVKVGGGAVVSAHGFDFCSQLFQHHAEEFARRNLQISNYFHGCSIAQKTAVHNTISIIVENAKMAGCDLCRMYIHTNGMGFIKKLFTKPLTGHIFSDTMDG